MGLIQRVQTVDSLPVIQVAILNATGTVLTSDLSSYGYWSADVYSSKPNVTNVTTTPAVNPTPIITLDSSTKLVACVALPGYFCYSPRTDEKRLNGTSV